MDIQEETYKILGEKILTNYDIKILVEWAVRLMIEGYDSASLIILAGLDNATTYEREEYFQKTLNELNINSNADRLELIDNYVVELAHKVASNTASPREAMTIIRRVLTETDYDDKYFGFFYLGEDIDELLYRGSTYYNRDLTNDNIDEFIKKEFEIFLRLREIDYDKSLNEKAYCNNCREIHVPSLKTKYQFKKPYRYKVYVCAKCKSTDIDLSSSQSAKIKILKAIN